MAKVCNTHGNDYLHRCDDGTLVCELCIGKEVSDPLVSYVRDLEEGYADLDGKKKTLSHERRAELAMAAISRWGVGSEEAMMVLIGAFRAVAYSVSNGYVFSGDV